MPLVWGIRAVDCRCRHCAHMVDERQRRRTCPSPRNPAENLAVCADPPTAPAPGTSPVSPEQIQRLKDLMEDARAYWELEVVMLRMARVEERELRRMAMSEARQEFDRAADAYFIALP